VITEKQGLVKEDINNALELASKENLKDILGYCDTPLVSIDFNSNPLSSIVDADCTDVINGNMVKIYSWYDNEAGYSSRMIDLAIMVGSSL
jgi:glyceraldehyde 3-phosphate dehydrogenase